MHSTIFCVNLIWPHLMSLFSPTRLIIAVLEHIDKRCLEVVSYFRTKE